MRARFGFNDSKQVTEEMRGEMFKNIKAIEGTELGWLIHTCMPEDLSTVMLHVGNGKTLNTVSYDAAFCLIKHVLKLGFKVKSIICDQVGPPATQEREMRKYLGTSLALDTTIICESKADATYPVVSASSICAKVSRD